MGFLEVHFSLSSTIVDISISIHIAKTPTVTDSTAYTIIASVSLLLVLVVCEGCVDILVCREGLYRIKILAS